MPVIKPNKIQSGDCIGIIAPSRHLDGFNEQIKKSIALLKNLGFDVIVAKNINKKYYGSAGTIVERLDDLHTMFQNDKIKAIICALGGDSCNQLLPYLDYKLIKDNPKVFIGSSDITHLLLAINNETSLMTFHGPSLKDLYQLSTKSINTFSSQLKNDSFKVELPPDYQIIKPGLAQGPITGGNLFVVNALLSSIYAPDLNGKILFWEDIDDNLSAVEFQLYQLKLTGALGKIKGMVIGHIDKPDNDKNRPLEEIILEITKSYDFPIIKVDYFGHNVNDFYIFPIGSNVIIDTQKKIFCFM